MHVSEKLEFIDLNSLYAKDSDIHNSSLNKDNSGLKTGDKLVETVMRIIQKSNLVQFSEKNIIEPKTEIINQQKKKGIERYEYLSL